MKLPSSIFVKDQLPQHIVDSNPLFASFIEAYYEWLDQENEASGMATGIVNLRDIDHTIDSFVDHLIKELLNVDAPEIAIDKRLFLKHLQDLFTAKGSEKSFRLFFRMFYGIDVNVLYPSENILRASDGEWQETYVLTTDKIAGDVSKLPGTLIIGQTSTAYAGVETVESIFINGIEKHLIKFHDDFSGQFIVGEHVKALIDSDDELDFIINKTVQKINVVNRGIHYAIGDVVNISSATGHGAKAYVSNVTPPKLIKLNANYSKVGTTVTIDCGERYHLLTNGDSLFLEFKSGIQTGNFEVSNIVSNFIFQIEVEPAEIIVSNFVDVYNANVSGEILSVAILDGGYGYNDATFTIDSDVGTVGTLQGVFGAYSKLPGYWSSNRGIISNSLTVLQDNLKYQQFSYVIQSSESIIRWRDLFKKLVHPAGMQVFSETVISLEGETDVTADVPVYLIVMYDEINADLSEIEFEYQIFSRSNVSAAGYNTLAELKRVASDLPPVTTGEQYNLDRQDMFYEGRSNYNYDGTINQGYWGIVTTFNTDITFGSMPWGGNVFAGFYTKFVFKARNFRPELYYTAEEIEAEADISDRIIAIPDSFIKIIKIDAGIPVDNPPEINWTYPPV